MISYYPAQKSWIEEETGRLIQSMTVEENKEELFLVFETEKDFWEWWDTFFKKKSKRPDSIQYELTKGKDWFGLYLRDLERYCNFLEEEKGKDKKAFEDCSGILAQKILEK